MIVRARGADYNNRIGIVFFDGDIRPRRMVKFSAPEIVVVSEFQLIDEPTLSIDPETAQGLVDALFQLGFVPKGMAPLTNELTATKAHLADMKIIAFKQLGIK